MSPPVSIALVEDDPAMRRALRRLFIGEGWSVREYASAGDFLNDTECGDFDCLLLDLRLPGISGIELYAHLKDKDCKTPVVFLTGEGDIPTGVGAMKAGAIDFLTKPCEDTVLLRAIHEAALEGRRRREQAASLSAENDRLVSLSPRELEVLRHVITGRPNKRIAARLGISEQTVKVHRMRICKKTGLLSVAEWVRLAARHGIHPASVG
jgi:FixJ family two-component response regulator